MKTAIYIEEGRTQFVLTPETEIDKKVLDEIQSTDLKTYRGDFYGCQGGWTRHFESFGVTYAGIDNRQSERSLIFVIDKAAPGVDPKDARPDELLVNPRCTYHERCSLCNGHEGSHYTEPTVSNPLGRRMGGQ